MKYMARFENDNSFCVWEVEDTPRRRSNYDKMGVTTDGQSADRDFTLYYTVNKIIKSKGPLGTVMNPLWVDQGYLLCPKKRIGGDSLILYNTFEELINAHFNELLK